jgi:hypothetical protein
MRGEETGQEKGNDRLKIAQRRNSKPGKKAAVSIWHKNGYIVIPVTRSHIDQSMQRNSSHCMTALAIAEAIPDATHIAVDLQCIRLSRRGLRYVFLTPHVAQDNIGCRAHRTQCPGIAQQRADVPQ